MKRINSKIFKILLITTLLSPTIFFQVACHQKNDKSSGEEDAKIKKNDEFEKEINLLKIKINGLEEIKANLDKQLEPFKNLMREHNVDNFDDLIKKLFAIDDFELLEKSLIFASCLLETETITWSKLSEKFDNVQWKNKNKEILNNLLPVLGLKSINDLTSHLIIDNKIKTLAEQISKINDSNFIKNMKAKIKEDREKIKKITNELISCYLAWLADEKYTDWDNFVRQFDIPTWKNDKKNKLVIEKLLELLNCSIDDLNASKINGLGKEVIDKTQELIKNQKKIFDGLKVEINTLESELKILKDDKDKDWNSLQNEKTELERQLETKKNELEEKTDQYNKAKDELISHYIARLADEKYIDWENLLNNLMIKHEKIVTKDNRQLKNWQNT